MMMFRNVCVAAVLMLAVGATFSPSVTAQTGTVVDEIVAVVGEEIILRSDVDGYVAGLLQQQNMPYSDDLWAQALNQLIDLNVMAVHARRDTTIEVPDDRVEQSLDQRIQQLTAQVGGEEKLEELYGKSVPQVKADLRDEFRAQMLADQLRNRKMQQIKVTPSEVRDWFEQFPTDSLPTIPEMVRIAHVVRYPQITEAARQEARDILSTIRDSIVVGGASFEEMATTFSDDPGSVSTGGRYQGIKLSELEPEFAAVASRIPVGEVSQVFETRRGPHILRVNERQGEVVDFNHILIMYDDTKTDASDAVALLETVRDSIVTHGMPFELMARRHSEEEMSSIQGGRVTDPRSGVRDLPLEALDLSWRTTINSLGEGEISAPQEAQLLDGKRAFHILLLQRRTPAHVVDIQTDYERIEQIALQDKQEREMRRWLDRLREDVYINLRGKGERLLASN